MAKQFPGLSHKSPPVHAEGGLDAEGLEEGLLLEEGMDEGTPNEGAREDGLNEGRLLGNGAIGNVSALWREKGNLKNKKTITCAGIVAHWVQTFLARGKLRQVPGLASVGGASSAWNQCIRICHGESVARIGRI